MALPTLTPIARSAPGQRTGEACSSRMRSASRAGLQRLERQDFVIGLRSAMTTMRDAPPTALQRPGVDLQRYVERRRRTRAAHQHRVVVKRISVLRYFRRRSGHCGESSGSPSRVLRAAYAMPYKPAQQHCGVLPWLIPWCRGVWNTPRRCHEKRLMVIRLCAAFAA